MKNIEIIYASTSGNTELALEYIVEKLKKNLELKFTMNRAEFTNPDILLNNNLFILGTSTWEHGTLNPFFNNLLKVIEQNDMTNKYAAFVGCGNTKYEQVLFCKGIDIVNEAFLSKGGKQIGTTLKVDGDPHEQLDSVVSDWVNNLKPELEKYLSTTN